MAFKGDEFTNPLSVPFRFTLDKSGNLIYQSSELKEANAAGQSLKRTAIDLKNPVNNFGGTGTEGSKSLWRIFLLGILGGFVGLTYALYFSHDTNDGFFFYQKIGGCTKRGSSMLFYMDSLFS